MGQISEQFLRQSLSKKTTDRFGKVVKGKTRVASKQKIRPASTKKHFGKAAGA